MPFFSCYPRSCVRTGDSPNPGGHNGQTTPQQRSLLAFAALSGTAPIWCHRLIGPWCCRATRARRTCRMVMLDAHSPSSIGPAMRERKAAYSSLESLLRRLFVPPLRPAACASSEDHFLILSQFCVAQEEKLSQMRQPTPQPERSLSWSVSQRLNNTARTQIVELNLFVRVLHKIG